MNKFKTLCMLYGIWWLGVKIEDLTPEQVGVLERMYEIDDLGSRNLKDYVYNKLRQKAENEARRVYQFLVQT